MYFSSIHQKPLIRFSLVNTKEFTIRADKTVNKQVISLIKMVNGVRFDWDTSRWIFPLNAHDTLQVALTSAQVLVEPLPRMALVAAQIHKRREQQGISKDLDHVLGERIHERLFQALAPFQRQGVHFVLMNEGRAMIADEMGLGKTIQAIASAVVFRGDWPVLVTSPSSARYQWQAEISSWLIPEILREEEVALVESDAFVLHRRHKFVIVSYGMLQKMEVQLTAMAFNMIIVDESHYIKNSQAKRTKTLVPLLHKAKRVLLLSGTPALSRPVELFSQLHALAPNEWNDERLFCERYCGGHGSRWGSTQTSSNTVELHAMLRGTIMIRRLKRDILASLPKKVRKLVNLSLEQSPASENLRGLLEECRARKGDSKKKRPRPEPAATGEDQTCVADTDEKKGPRPLLMELFTKSGVAKLPAVLDHLQTFLDDPLSGKALVFGHHKAVLDSIVHFLSHRNVEFVRIDGQTLGKERHSNVLRFQKSGSCRIAVLAITAAGTALTLTAAATVFFAELFWTPGSLLQAEDRVHRIGQTSTVVINYFVAKGSVDEILWPLLRKKMRTLGEVVEGEEGLDLVAESDETAASVEDESSIEGELLEVLAAEETVSSSSMPRRPSGAGSSSRAKDEDDEEPEDSVLDMNDVDWQLDADFKPDPLAEMYLTEIQTLGGRGGAISGLARVSGPVVCLTDDDDASVALPLSKTAAPPAWNKQDPPAQQLSSYLQMQRNLLMRADDFASDFLLRATATTDSDVRSSFASIPAPSKRMVIDVDSPVNALLVRPPQLVVDLSQE